VDSRFFYENLRRYSRALLQRNEQIRQDVPGNIDQRGIWDSQLAVSGAVIIRGRMKMLQNLKGLLEQRLLHLTDGRLSLNIEYRPSVKSTDDPEEAILEALNDSRERENIFRTTVVGPHRDNFVFLDGTKDMRRFSSQGEVRMAVLALKLALVAFFAEFRGMYPVLLLDDILLEIDRRNMEKVLEGFNGRNQFFFTSTGVPDIPFFNVLKSSSFFFHQSVVKENRDGR